jgi:hypothetical protein
MAGQGRRALLFNRRVSGLAEGAVAARVSTWDRRLRPRPCCWSRSGSSTTGPTWAAAGERATQVQRPSGRVEVCRVERRTLPLPVRIPEAGWSRPFVRCPSNAWQQVPAGRGNCGRRARAGAAAAAARAAAAAAAGLLSAPSLPRPASPHTRTHTNTHRFPGPAYRPALPLSHPQPATIRRRLA